MIRSKYSNFIADRLAKPSEHDDDKRLLVKGHVPRLTATTPRYRQPQNRSPFPVSEGRVVYFREGDMRGEGSKCFGGVGWVGERTDKG